MRIYLLMLVMISYLFLPITMIDDINCFSKAEASYIYSNYPKAVQSGAQILVELTIKNDSGMDWNTANSRFVYNWTDVNGDVIANSGGTIALPYNVPKTQMMNIKLNAVSPKTYSGNASLQITLVTDGVERPAHKMRIKVLGANGQMAEQKPTLIKTPMTKPVQNNNSAKPAVLQPKNNGNSKNYNAAPVNNRNNQNKTVSNVNTNHTSTNTNNATNIQANSYTISGRGYGHAVGMSQWGARGMALKGFKCNDIIGHYYQGATVEKDDEFDDPIRVALAMNKSSAVIVPQSVYRVIDLDSKTLLYEGHAKERVSIAIMSGTVKVDIDDKFFVSSKILIETEGIFTFNDQLQYRDSLIARSNSKGLLDLINQLELEEYLMGVISKEMSPSFPIEALKAQAIASRSYARCRMMQSKNKSFDVYPSEISQVYSGISGESTTGNQAVNATKNLYAMYQGKTVEAFFFSNSGGHTESNENVWQSSPIPYLRGVPDDYSGYQNDNQKSRYGIWWSQNYPLSQLEGIFNVGSISSIEVTEKYPSGRPAKVRVVGSSKTNVYTAAQFRKLVDPNNKVFRSSWFMIEKK